jgi:hypothetical protein
MEEVLLVHKLKARYHLVGEHAASFQRKLAATVLKQIFE